jgi:hypothetical protein
VSLPHAGVRRCHNLSVVTWTRDRRVAIGLLGVAAAGFVGSLAIFPYRAHASMRPFLLATAVSTVAAVWGGVLLIREERWRKAGIGFASLCTAWAGALAAVFWVLLHR